jgi:hypothetical protein
MFDDFLVLSVIDRGLVVATGFSDCSEVSCSVFWVVVESAVLDFRGTFCVDDSKNIVETE